MLVETYEIEVSTRGYSDIVNLSSNIEKLIFSSGLREGSATIFAVGSTFSITTLEYEPGLLKDIPEVLDRIAPYGKPYEHNNTWNDDNGAAHIRASIVGSSVIVPFKDKLLFCGTWQQIVAIDFDTRPRQRKVIVQLQGK